MSYVNLSLPFVIYGQITFVALERIHADDVITELGSKDSTLTAFDNGVWLQSIEKVTVNRDGSLLFRFFSGAEITG